MQAISLDFTPWPHQLPSLQARKRGYKRRLKLWHRRAGKDLSSTVGAVDAAQEEVGIYYHMFPELAQGRKILWDGMDNTGRRFLDYIPKALIKGKPNETEMQVEFQNGSLYQVIGADRLSWIGTNPRGVIFSEYQRQDPKAWDYMRPILTANGGWAEFCYTPLGHNHGHKLYEMARKNPSWFCEKLTVLDTFKADGSRIVSDALIDEERASGMDEDLIQQEYFCSFEGAMQGSYYGELLKEARSQNRVTLFRHDPHIPVITAWDIGVGDATAIGWFQRIGREHHLVDYYESNGKGLDHYARVLQQRSLERKYLYEHVEGKIACIGPHDMKAREFGTGRTRQEQARDYGLYFRLVKRQSLEDGIAAVRRIFPALWLHEKHAERVIDAAGHYHKEWDEVKQCFGDKPVHDWCFAGETKVLTRYGTYQIMDLPQSGEVLTVCGWKPYTNPRITRRNARLVEVEFSDGLTVRCTPDHTFLTASGWISAEALTKGSVIQSTLTPLRSISMVGSIVFGRARHTLREAVRSCTEMFGKGRSALSHVDATFITGTAIHGTTYSATLSASPLNTISLSTGIGTACLAPKPWKRLLSGTDQKRGGCGIAEMHSGQNRGSSGSAWRSLAYSAKSLFNVWKERTGTLKSIAAQTVKPLHIVRVTAVSELADVWCLTVPDSAHFSLSNGAVVHNCSHPMDMLRYYALSTRDEPAYTGSIKAVADFDPYSEGVTEAEHEFNPYEVGA